MGNLASGHFKPTNNIQEQHNDRTLSPSYLIPQEFSGQNEVNRPSTQARGLRDKIIENAKETYLIAFKQKLKSKSYQWSLVVNIKTNTTMSDLEKLAEHFEVKYGFQCYQIAIHRDEGYMDENNQPHINHHAHMEFVTLNKENGKNMWRQINQIKLRQIQTEIAQILGMERGTDKRISGTERIEPRKYAQMKNKERKELEVKKKELNTLKQEKDNLTNQLQKQATETKKDFGVF
ncbi:plasmid recombination protein [Helicobacter pylori]|uniref:plasmid recombination protein n=1 Tax=Helicobacter pylori TaxID=210 RepID=UPI002159F1C0|nr:plasmid recombination protein [Helicobacter pylori]